MKSFEGVLTFVDTPSDRAPNGARGHRLILKRVAAEAALSSLIGTPLNRQADFETHDKTAVVGTILDAWIDKKNRLHVRGSVEEDLLGKRPNELGMSFEVKNVHIDNMLARVWVVNKCEFEGAAVLKRHKAAYQSTTFTVKRRGFA